MAMYRKDKFGEYKRVARWVDAWRGEGGTIIAGWCVSELREYADGTKRVHSEPARYVGDEHRSAGALHEIYILASTKLMGWRHDGVKIVRCTEHDRSN